MSDSSYNPFLGFVKKENGNGSYHRNGGGRGANGKSSGGDMGRSLKPVDWDKATLVPGKWKVVDTTAIRMAASNEGSANKVKAAKPMNEEEAQEWRKANGITVIGDGCPPPVVEMDKLTMLPTYILKKFAAQGFTAPTSVQAQSWPALLNGRDVVGVAKTGSGKTLAFMVPAIVHIEAQEPLRRGDGPIVLVLAPTRELAQQIEQETKKVLSPALYCGCVYGGAPKGPQLGLLREGVHILVATPGRLIDFIEIRRVSLLRVTYLVLDEADRMLDMGFEPQIRAICGQIRPDRQTLMFSATWPREIQQLASTFQKDWIRLNVGSTELVANKDVTQRFVLTRDTEKLDELKKIMTVHRGTRVLVFCKTKRTADYLENQLKRMGYDAMAIHGDKEQRQREFVLERFRRDSRLCLVATDVAARGLDIKQLEVVVNYDFPMQIDDYVHRIGRTGRAGAKGESITFITKQEKQLSPQGVPQLIGILERAQQEVPQWMRDWAAQNHYQTPRRNRNYMGDFGRGGGGRGNGRMPSLHYSHSDRPSFDPSAQSCGGGTNGKSYFGLSSGQKEKSNGGGGGGNGFTPSSERYQRFASSDDDDAGAKDPDQPLKKKCRT